MDINELYSELGKHISNGVSGEIMCRVIPTHKQATADDSLLLELDSVELTVMGSQLELISYNNKIAVKKRP